MAQDSELIGRAVDQLRAYRALLLESRSGAASETEQRAQLLTELIEALERRLGKRADQSS